MKRRRRGRHPKKTRGPLPLQRLSSHRSEKVGILIVGEGRETEPNYFRALRNEQVVRQNFNVVVKKGQGGSPVAVVKQAIEEKNKAATRGEDFDEIWCVFDVEGADRRQQVLEARRLAELNGIWLALSNPSFEVWLLSHFVRTKRSFASSDKVVDELAKYWRREFEQDYHKIDEHLYARVAGRTQKAIDNARRVREQDWDASNDLLDCNSSTEIYLLVQRLLG
jgi:hypothetical protein